MPKEIVVQKYGGTSVANIDRIKNVAQRVVATCKKGKKVVVVVSALGDTTDKLIALASQITKEPAEREMDMLISTGEQVSIALLAMAIHKLGKEAISFTGSQVGIITDKFHTKARIIGLKTNRIKEELKKGKVVIVAGFQGTTEESDITTLGRGGSNMTAVALAKALNASVCEMYTDVDGVFTTDPRIVPKAHKIDRLSYDEMMEMASTGAQVLQLRSVEFAKKYNIPIHVRCSFNNKKGTLITKEIKSMEDIVVSGVTLNKNEAKVTMTDVPDKPGVAAKIFKELARMSINVDMIVQNISRTRATDISFTVPKTDLNKTLKIARKVGNKVKSGKILSDTDIAKVSVVGIGMRSHSGIAAIMFEALAKAKINIEMISTSEIKISCIIGERHAKKALRVLHKVFGL